MKTNRLFGLLTASVGLASLAIAQRAEIDPGASVLTIHVGKTGFLAGMGHEHWVRATIDHGFLVQGAHPSIEFTVLAAQLTVMDDPKVSKSDQAKIQRDMQDKVLQSSAFPQITFRSSSIVQQGAKGWSVVGNLTLHGVTKSVQADVKKDGDRYSGTAHIKQTDFGIKPISVAGGMIRVRDLLDITFVIVPGNSRGK